MRCLERRRGDRVVMDAERFLINVGSISSCSEACHGCQISTISPHCLYDENPALRSSCRLLYSVAAFSTGYSDEMKRSL
ncbi:hypothetical protein AOLI_G00008970 [Acnodon oligacanthus]